MLDLYEAILKGQIDVITDLIEKGADVNQVLEGTNGKTPLCLAVEKNHLNIVKRLIEKGANVNAAPPYGPDEEKTPLCFAAINGNLDIAKFLVKKGADVNVSCYDHLNALNLDSVCRLSPVCLAAREGHLDMLKFLIENGATKNAVNDYVDNIIPPAPFYLAARNTPLCIAAKKGHLDVVKFLIQKNANTINDNYTTALCVACEAGQIEIAKLLVENGADVHIPCSDVYGYDTTPLCYAAKHGHLEIVKFLVEKGAKVNESSPHNLTPLYAACDDNLAQFRATHLPSDEFIDQITALDLSLRGRAHSDVAKFLIEQGANVNVACDDGVSPLFLVASVGPLDVARFLVEKGAKVNAIGFEGMTPLHLAAAGGQLDIAKLLVENGASVHVKSVDGITPLHIATFMGQLDIAKLLVEKGANVNSVNTKGATVLHGAVLGGKLDLVKFLIKNGADVNAACFDGQTPLCLAANHSYKILKFLIENGANVNTVQADRKTPLCITAEDPFCKQDQIKLLIDNGADVNAARADGATPLCIMTEHCYRGIENVKYLVKKGANVNAARVDGTTPLWYAAEHGHLDIIQFLLDNGADINAKHVDGTTPYEIAFKNNHFDIAKILAERQSKNNPKNQSDSNKGKDFENRNKQSNEDEDHHSITNIAKIPNDIVTYALEPTMAKLSLDELKNINLEINEAIKPLEEIDKKRESAEHIMRVVKNIQLGTVVFSIIPALVGMVYHWFTPKANNAGLLDKIFGGISRGFNYIPAKIASAKTGLDFDWDLKIISAEEPLKKARSVFEKVGMSGIIVPGCNVLNALHQLGTYLKIKIKQGEEALLSPEESFNQHQNKKQKEAPIVHFKNHKKESNTCEYFKNLSLFADKQSVNNDCQPLRKRSENNVVRPNFKK